MGKISNIANAPYVQKLISPIGDLYIGASDIGLIWIKLIDDHIQTDTPNGITHTVAEQLTSYFEGNLCQFDITLDLSGYTDFSLSVWAELSKIPYGQTISYMQLAVRLGDPKCIRAAATANGRNPIPIVIPCHRVIGSDGSLTGFALGLNIKKQLLAIENPRKYKWVQVDLFD